MSILGISRPPEPPTPPRSTRSSRSLNPFALWGRSLEWRGTFTGREVFYVLLTLLLAGAALPVLLSVSGVIDPDQPTGGLIVQWLMRAWLAWSLVVAAGSIVRRLRDLGLTPWLGLLALAPVLNAVFLLYLMFAPADDGPAGRRAPFSIAALGKSAAALLLCGSPLALSLPALLRSRAVANERAAIEDLRAIVAAQAAYQGLNGGQWEGRWDCLAGPGACLPGYSGPALLPREALRSPRMGYVREFHVGPRAEVPPARSPTSVLGYAVVARPASSRLGPQRSFCTDTSGRLCQLETDTLTAPLVEATRDPEGVRCVRACSDLR